MDFETIYKTYWQKVYRICMGYVNDTDTAKDLAQETFVKVLQQLHNFRNEAAIGTWIFRIASNTCLRQLQRDKKIVTSELPMELKEEAIETTIEKEVQILYRCISELKEVDRIIISLELEDMDQKEIAKIIGISEGYIRVRIHRIKEKLRNKFKKYGS